MPVREAAFIVRARGGGRVGGRAACAGWWAWCGDEGGRTCRRGGRGLQEAQDPRWSRCLAQVTGGPVGRSRGWGAQWGPGVSVQTPLAYGISLRASPGASRSDQWMWPLLRGGSRAQAAPTAPSPVVRARAQHTCRGTRAGAREAQRWAVPTLPAPLGPRRVSVTSGAAQISPTLRQQGPPEVWSVVLTVLHWPGPGASPGPVPLDASSRLPSSRGLCTRCSLCPKYSATSAAPPHGLMTFHP